MSLGQSLKQSVLLWSSSILL